MVRPVHKWGRESSANHDFYPLLPINLLDDAFADFMTQLAVYYSEKDSLHRLQIGFVGGWQLFPLDSENYIDGMERLCLAPQDSLSNQTFGVIGEGDRPLVWQDGRAVYGGEIKQGSIFKVRLNAEAEHTQEDSNGEEIVVKGEWRIVEPVLNGEDNFFLQQMLANTYDSEGYNTISNVAGSLDNLDESQFSTFFDFGVPGGVGWVDGFPLLPSTPPNWNSLFLLVDKASDNIRQEGFQIITDVNSSSIRTLPFVPAAFAELTDDLRAVSAFARNRKPDGTWSDWTYRINNIQARKGIEWETFMDASPTARTPERYDLLPHGDHPHDDTPEPPDEAVGGYLITDTLFPHLGINSLTDITHSGTRHEDVLYDPFNKGLNKRYAWGENLDNFGKLIANYDILRITGFIERYWQSSQDSTAHIRRTRFPINDNAIYPVINDIPQKIDMKQVSVMAWGTAGSDDLINTDRVTPNWSQTSARISLASTLTHIYISPSWDVNSNKPNQPKNLPIHFNINEGGIWIGLSDDSDLDGTGDIDLSNENYMNRFFRHGSDDLTIDSQVGQMTYMSERTGWWSQPGTPGTARSYRQTILMDGLYHRATLGDDWEQIFYIPYITVQAAKLPR